MLRRLFLFFLLFLTSLQAEEYDVVVVGAGFAGIVAAHDLNKAGIKTVVVEARDRIGGRTWTVEKWGRKLELGGAWIHKIFNNPVYDFSQLYNMKTAPTIFSAGNFEKLKSYSLYDEEGKKVSSEELEDVLKHFNSLKAFATIYFLQKAENVTLGELVEAFIQSEKLNPRQAKLLTFILNNSPELYSGVKDISVPTLVSLESKVSGRDVTLPEGYSYLLNELSKELEIVLNSPITKIEECEKGVQVTSTAGKIYYAKYVVVTVPLGVLKENTIEFVPPLPPQKQEAIKKLGMAVVDKVFLNFERPFWDLESEWIMVMMPPEKHQYEFFNTYKHSGGTILLAFTASDFACDVEQLTDAQVVEDVMSNLRVAYGKEIPMPKDFIVTRWGIDPFAGGAYSYPRIGSTVDDYATLAEPINNRIFFAGEATSKTNPSTVTGAFLTGQAVAQKIKNLQ